MRLRPERRSPAVVNGRARELHSLAACEVSKYHLGESRARSAAGAING